MTCLRSVALIALPLAAVTALYAVALRGPQTQPMQRGISVQLAATRNAAPMPAADNQDAWIVTVTADGNFYFGIDPVTSESLTEQMKIHPRNRDAKLYIKADARAPFASVAQVLEAARVDLFDAPVLLTSQPELGASGALVPPKGLEVLISASSRGEPVVVQLSNFAQPSPTLKVNNTEVPNNALQDTLRKLLQNHSEKIIVVKAAGATPFAQVAHVIDLCRSTGAQVILPSSAS